MQRPIKKNRKQITALGNSDFKSPRYMVATGRMLNKYKSFRYQTAKLYARRHARQSAGENAICLGVRIVELPFHNAIEFDFQVQEPEVIFFSTRWEAEKYANAI